MKHGYHIWDCLNTSHAMLYEQYTDQNKANLKIENHELIFVQYDFVLIVTVNTGYIY